MPKLITRRALLLFRMPGGSGVTDARAARVCRELRQSHAEWITLRNGAGRTLHVGEIPAFKRLVMKWRAFHSFWRRMYRESGARV